MDPPSGVARIFQQGGPKRGSEATERGEGGVPPPTVGRFFENSCMKTAFSSTLNDIIGGGVVMWGGMYTNPLYIPLFKIYFTPIKGEHGPLCILAIAVTVVQPGFVNGGQSEGAKRPSGGRVWEGGFPPPTVGRFFWKFVYENEISCTLNAIIRGLVMWSDVYQSHTLPFFEKLFYSNQGDGDMSPCALSYASEGGAARICPRGPKRGSEATERGGGCGRGFSPSHGREIFENSCIKTAFLAH